MVVWVRVPLIPPGQQRSRCTAVVKTAGHPRGMYLFKSNSKKHLYIPGKTYDNHQTRKQEIRKGVQGKNLRGHLQLVRGCPGDAGRGASQQEIQLQGPSHVQVLMPLLRQIPLRLCYQVPQGGDHEHERCDEL